ncbi:MAG TPA: glutamine--fructose-6-phosphate transaminase (isomerizing), partial [Terriglobales bacterium]|nr:glutamine--fructose-6-phosphate transaminase (isomerizing) [Terriglobales bacterium]
MCGIVGYIGKKRVVPVILDGLKRLEYRGYDSAGIAVIQTGDDGKPHLEVRRAQGKLRNLEESIRLLPLEGHYGIGHTRWATHGRPTEENAHPHRDCKGEIVVVHNGIIENYLPLKRELIAQGHAFRTETDTEVVAHLVEEQMRGEGTLEAAVLRVLPRLTGVYALAVISTRDPDKIVAVRNGPPAVIGLGQDEYFVASDIPALLHHTRDVFFLADGDVAVLTPQGVRLMDLQGRPVKREITHISWDPILAEKGGFKHFMLKEIYEQPRAVRDTLLGRLSRDRGEVFLDEMELTAEDFRGFASARIVACGTSWHAALAGKYLFERLARFPTEVDYGSEFRYRDPLVGPGQLTLLISQSGETADTLAALREARDKGSRTLAICNVVGSMLTREANGALLTHAGPEIGVASTKAFTGQLTALVVLALYLGRTRGTLEAAAAMRFMEEFDRLPAKLESLLNRETQYEDLARRFYRARDFLYLGRGIHFPIALEGALKLKEVSYIHAEGYPAGEMKHGPNALIDENLPVVVLAAHDPSDPDSVTRYEKTLSNIKEVKAREGEVIAIGNAGDA